MCFGERTRCICTECGEKSWETRWYNFGAGATNCANGWPHGSCSDPWMVYHNETTICANCLGPFVDAETSPELSTVPDTWHPDDTDRRGPQIPNYDQSEFDTMRFEGRLTLPGIVAGALHWSLDTPGGNVSRISHVPQHLLTEQINEITAARNAASTPALDSRPSSPHTPEPILQGPLPNTALPNTPLPSYSQAISRPPPPNFLTPEMIQININYRLLKRLSDWTHHLRWQLVPLETIAIDILTRIASTPGARDIFSAANIIKQSITGTIDTASYHYDLIMQGQTTYDDACALIASITRNPHLSVRNLVRRFREWLIAMEAEIGVLVHTNRSGRPGRRTLNQAFQREEMRDQIKQGLLDAELADVARANPGDLLMISMHRARDQAERDVYNVDDETDHEYANGFVPVDIGTGLPIDLPDFLPDGDAEDAQEYDEAGIEEAVALMEFEDNGDELYTAD
ncbi:hypothetical protein D6D10_09801 [Aureobasidium pullulans]|uniref:Uncharacterized protein n=1 Tax=Aureobasidium pullulans TaxID=5580 RepID=A0A4V4J4X0_AURPU|nr:hypothetical protein D6D10_09801 [Aureobasidium pullulans]